MMRDMSTRRTYLAALTSVSVGIGLAGCSGDDNSDSASGGGGGDETDAPEDENTPQETEEVTDEPEDDTPDVTILEHELVEDDFMTMVAGKVENTSGDEQSYIQVTANFYDADDVRIDESMWNATDVPDGEVLKFELMTSEEADDIDRYELETGTSPF